MLTHKTFTKNINGKDFIIGDLHGCYNQLCLSLKSVGFNKDADRLFSVGDLVDRGRNNQECLALIQEPWFHAVMGNHEDLMLRANGISGYQQWAMNGGGWDYTIPEEAMELLKEKTSKLPLAITLETSYGKIGITHAEPPNDWLDINDEDLEYSLTQSFLWSRTKITHKYTDIITNIDYTVHGHTPIKDVVSLGNSLYIDTGAVYGGYLTIIDVEDIPELVKKKSYVRETNV